MSKKKRILKGDANFEYIVANNGYFVDKTLLIKEFLDNADKVLLMPRPRRFGKTSNLSMIEHFFDVRKQESAPLFDEFKINENKSFCEQHQNKYPVINISLKSVKGEDWAKCLELMIVEVAGLYEKHDYLLDSKKLKSYEKRRIERIILKQEATAEYTTSLFNLSKYLQAHFGEQVIILVDEYDTPIIDGFSKKYYQKIIDFMRVFLGKAYKENPHLKKGLVTGIMRIAKESLFSELNNLGIYTITSPFFSDKFGFTEPETKKLLTYFGLEAHFSQVKKWYDGYQFGNTSQIYNPWSIVTYIARYQEGFKTWWANTGTDTLIKERIVQPDPNKTYNTLQKLISGETINEKLYENFIFPDFDLDRELIWTLLTFSGYLTQIKETDRSVYLLKIPNYEVKTVFQDIIMGWLQRNFKVKRKLLVSTTEHLLNNQLKKFERGFKLIMNDTLSYWDITGEPERVYQAYVLGILAIVGDDYIIRSNREAGKGRYDVMILPHDKSRYGVVIEIKQIERNRNEKEDTFLGRINKSLLEAKNQIESKKYYKELQAHQVTKIIKLPIVFAEKEPYIFPVKIKNKK